MKEIYTNVMTNLESSTIYVTSAHETEEQAIEFCFDEFRSHCKSTDLREQICPVRKNTWYAVKGISDDSGIRKYRFEVQRTTLFEEDDF